MNCPRPPRATLTLYKSATCLALLASGVLAHAAEGYKLRQSPVGAFGGEVAAQADNPGFFGTIALSSATIDKVTNERGEDIQVPGRSLPLPTGKVTGGLIADGSYQLVVPAGTIDFHQTQRQINLLGGYMTEATYNGGRFAFAINIPLIKQERSFITGQAAGVVSPVPAPIFPANLRAAITAVGAAANAQVVAGVAATAATHNQEVSGIGDTELSLVWVRHQDRLKIAAGVSVFTPTGVYDKARGPNPGFGNFYTIRPGVAVSYVLNPKQSDDTWDAGLTIAGRLSYGYNTRNKDTDYHSGNFTYTEAAMIKVAGHWAAGFNVLRIEQVSDDTGPNVIGDGGRYKNTGFGPFIAFKVPGKDAGFNLQYARNVGSRNALVANTIQLRFIKAW